MTDDRTHIRALVQRWASAVHRGDMEGVLADHSDDIVMFNVPPPSVRARVEPLAARAEAADPGPP